MAREATLDIGGRKVPVSNLDKVLYPRAGFTKADLIDYYVAVGEFLLPHLKDRALTLKRYPNGVEGSFFYEKRCPAHRPTWVQTAAIESSSEGVIDYCLANDLPTLVWAANLADLELHTSLAKKQNPDRPTVLAFDLDPGPGCDIVTCCKIAVWLRNLLAGQNLNGYPKTSGSKGLQVYFPLNTPATFDQTKAYAHAVADELVAQHPQDVVSVMAKAARRGKVFIDWSQNDRHKTTVNVYSLRAKDQPTVSTPVTWREVETCLRKGNAALLRFTATDVKTRVKKRGDLFEPVLTQKQKLPK